MKRLDEEQKPEHEDETYVEFITENGKRQKGLRNEEPESVIKPLKETSGYYE